ncbi:MAG: hypothetical protein WC846_00170 [Candidatus Gracilibacteria bacterium]|jgi:hypothetical protein
MSLTLFAILLTPFALKMVLDPASINKMIKEWTASTCMQVICSAMLLGLSTLIFLSNGINFTLTPAGTTSWLGLVIALKGIACLFPQIIKLQSKILTESRIPIFGFSALVFLLLLVYIDTLA